MKLDNQVLFTKFLDKEHCEEYGRMLQADASKVSMKAKKRGLPQLGTLGAGVLSIAKNSNFLYSM